MNVINPEDNLSDENDAPAEVDFSNAEIGKFYRHNAIFCFPVYLDATVQAWLIEKAAHKGVAPADITNDLLKRDIEITEAMK